MAPLIIAMLLFVGTHVVLSGTPLRGTLVGTIGARPFQGLFSVIALGTLVWSAMAYNGAPASTLWPAGAALQWINLVLVALGMVLLVAGATGRNPAAMGQESAIDGDKPATGILTVTRHPVSWGIALWAAGHILANGDAASLVFFGGLIAVGLIGSWSQEHKKQREFGERWARYAAATSFVPFAAIAQGRTKLDIAGIGWWRLAVAVILFVALLALHPMLFGVSPLPG